MHLILYALNAKEQAYKNMGGDYWAYSCMHPFKKPG